MKSLLLLAVFFSSAIAVAQNKQSFRQLRYDEDYLYLSTDSSMDWYHSMKYNPLFGKQNYLSIGGDIRYQFLKFSNEGWGEDPDDDGYLLTRYLLHGDLHLGKQFRTFVQLQSSLANGMEKSPSPVDENQLDLHQAFVDIVPFTNKMRTTTIRAGRQEMLFGSQRLVAVRDGPNNRQSFDALRLIHTTKNLRGDLFFSHYVQSRRGIFDDGFQKKLVFWGAYIVRNRLPVIKNLDVYYFGIRKEKAVFDDGSGKELRHSIGSRIWNSSHSFRYDLEGLYQFGKFNEAAIDAWTLSINAGYKFKRWRRKPELGLKTEIISGDRQYGDNKLQTFNPLFPRGGYFGLISLIGPVNLVDIHPSVAVDFTSDLLIEADCDIFFRHRVNDGIYGPNVALIYSGKGSRRYFVGNQYSTDLIYTPNHFLSFRAELTWFKAGSFLKESGRGEDILFAAFTAGLKF